MIIPFEDRHPFIDPSAFVAPTAFLVGQVEVGPEASVWYGAVVRGDQNTIRIGVRTNVQDLVVLHVDGRHPLTIGSDVTIGHRAILHGCTIGAGALVGMGAIVMNGAVVGEEAMVGAGALVTEGTVIPPRTLAVGVPAKVRRELTEEERAQLRASAEHYLKLAKSHAALPFDPSIARS